MHLRNEAVAEIVVHALQGAADSGQLDLHAWCVMANHVHVLLTPRTDVSRLLQMLKGGTAREANKCLGVAGVPFWQHESYDHWTRNEEESQRIVAYIENNPVKAGLVAKASDYPWSSARRRLEADAAS